MHGSALNFDIFEAISAFCLRKQKKGKASITFIVYWGIIRRTLDHSNKPATGSTVSRGANILLFSLVLLLIKPACRRAPDAHIHKPLCPLIIPVGLVLCGDNIAGILMRSFGHVSVVARWDEWAIAKERRRKAKERENDL
jgi:hypothetical protein